MGVRQSPFFFKKKEREIIYMIKIINKN